MKPFLENSTVERILSLIVILYGLRLIIPSGEDIVYGAIASVTGWISFFDHLPGWLFVLSKPVVGCLLIVFFPHVVQWIGYFATEGKNRSIRHWSAREILAAPIILYAFTELLYVLFQGISICLGSIEDYRFRGVWDDYLIRGLVGTLLVLPVYFVFATMLLFYARRLAARLLHLSEPGFAASATPKRRSEP